jgi:hypothetical protein
MSIESFEAAVRALVAQGANIPLLRRVDEGRVTIHDYHSVLTTLFHQVSSSSSTFALAASQLDQDYWEAKAYLLHHADEEKTHWQWILSDLRETGFTGVMPDQALAARSFTVRVRKADEREPRNRGKAAPEPFRVDSPAV